MSKNKKKSNRVPADNLRLNPESRVCPQFNEFSLKEFEMPNSKMGVRVVDNCAEEHQM